MTALSADFDVAVGRGKERFALSVKLELEHGVLVFFGPSGTGKSVTVQTLVGVLRPESGRLQVGGVVLFDDHVFVPAHRRRVGYVPQHHSLFPFCDVEQNIRFGLPRDQRSRPGAVDELIEGLGLEHLRHAMPRRLSGGERQRVALARALAVKPRLLLLDEPFASIDQAGRADLRSVLLDTLDRYDTPAIFVTHDPIEALAVGDRMVRFGPGGTGEIGVPRDLLEDSLRMITDDDGCLFMELPVRAERV